MKSARRKRNVMLAYPYTSKDFERMTKPVIVQPKLDGIRCIARKVNGDVVLETSTGLQITSVPHIVSQLESLPQNDFVVDGELYNHDWTFDKLSSVVRRNDLHPEHESVSLYLFDYVVENVDQINRIGMLNSFPRTPNVKVLDFKYASSEQGVMKLLEDYYELGFEGVVVKDPFSKRVEKRSKDWLKIKPRKTDEYTIIDYSPLERKDGTIEPMIGSLKLTTELGEDFWVGTGKLLTASERVRLWDLRHKLIGSTAIIKYQNLTEREVPRFPALIEIKWKGETNGN